MVVCICSVSILNFCFIDDMMKSEPNNYLFKSIDKEGTRLMELFYICNKFVTNNCSYLWYRYSLDKINGYYLGLRTWLRSPQKSCGSGQSYDTKRFSLDEIVGSQNFLLLHLILFILLFNLLVLLFGSHFLITSLTRDEVMGYILILSMQLLPCIGTFASATKVDDVKGDIIIFYLKRFLPFHFLVHHYLHSSSLLEFWMLQERLHHNHHLYNHWLLLPLLLLPWLLHMYCVESKPKNQNCMLSHRVQHLYQHHYQHWGSDYDRWHSKDSYTLSSVLVVDQISHHQDFDDGPILDIDRVVLLKLWKRGTQLVIK